jgi:hypothetical protein
MQEDTIGVAGAVTANIAANGTRADPAYAGSFAFSNASFGSFKRAVHGRHRRLSQQAAER